MKRSTLILFLLFFVTAQILAVTSIKPDFDFFFFVQHWPGANDGDIAQSGKSSSSSKQKPSTSKGSKPSTSKGSKPGTSSKASKPGTCSSKLEKETSEDFGIHGLWPEYDDGTWPEYCDRNKENPRVYDPSLIPEKLLKDLKDHWHSLASPSEDGNTVQKTNKFGKKLTKKKAGTWEHEWDKHGTCSLFDQNGYFDAAIKLKKRKNILEILKGAGINPNGSGYTFDQIITALIEGLTEGMENIVTPGIECNSKGELYQVYICVDKSDDLKFINCPVYPMLKNCDRKELIIFPS